MARRALRCSSHRNPELDGQVVREVEGSSGLRLGNHYRLWRLYWAALNEGSEIRFSDTSWTCPSSRWTRRRWTWTPISRRRKNASRAGWLPSWRAPTRRSMRFRSRSESVCTSTFSRCGAGIGWTSIAGRLRGSRLGRKEQKRRRRLTWITSSRAPTGRTRPASVSRNVRERGARLRRELSPTRSCGTEPPGTGLKVEYPRRPWRSTRIRGTYTQS